MKEDRFKELTSILVEILDYLKAIEYSQSSCLAVLKGMRADQINGKWNTTQHRLPKNDKI